MPLSDAKYVAKRHTLREVCATPQIFEVDCEDGTILYIRFKDENLTVRNKKTNELLCSGYPYLEKGQEKVDIKRIEFYVEMYSKFLIQFN